MVAPFWLLVIIVVRGCSKVQDWGINFDFSRFDSISLDSSQPSKDSNLMKLWLNRSVMDKSYWIDGIRKLEILPWIGPIRVQFEVPRTKLKLCTTLVGCMRFNEATWVVKCGADHGAHLQHNHRLSWGQRDTNRPPKHWSWIGRFSWTSPAKVIDKDRPTQVSMWPHANRQLNVTLLIIDNLTSILLELKIHGSDLDMFNFCWRSTPRDWARV